MNMRTRTYGIIVLGILGWFVSWAFFYVWLAEHDWGFFAGWAEAFTSSDFATGLIMDLVLVSFMMIFLAFTDRKKIGAQWSIAVVLSLSVSVSISLMLYLLAHWKNRGEVGEGATPEADG